jgi:hypothetical protein
VVAVAERLSLENATLVLKTYGYLMPDSEDRTQSRDRRRVERRLLSQGAVGRRKD